MHSTHHTYYTHHTYNHTHSHAHHHTCAHIRPHTHTPYILHPHTTHTSHTRTNTSHKHTHHTYTNITIHIEPGLKETQGRMLAPGKVDRFPSCLAQLYKATPYCQPPSAHVQASHPLTLAGGGDPACPGSPQAPQMLLLWSPQALSTAPCTKKNLQQMDVGEWEVRKWKMTTANY